MGQREEAIRLVCPPEEIELGEEWLRMPLHFCITLSVNITLRRARRLKNPVAVETEVHKWHGMDLCGMPGSQVQLLSFFFCFLLFICILLLLLVEIII
jgi:hypothetical protein